MAATKAAAAKKATAVKALGLTDVPVMRKQVVMEHISLSWADFTDEGSTAEDWVLVRTSENECCVVDFDERDRYSSDGVYDFVHGPFKLEELRAALTLVARRNVAGEGTLEYVGEADWWAKITKAGVTFSESSEKDRRAFVRSGENEVTIIARCGETYTASLSKLRLIVRKAANLAVVAIDQ